jgi:hypothetical protein
LKRAAVTGIDLSLTATGLITLPDDIFKPGAVNLVQRYTYGEKLTNAAGEHRRLERLAELEARVLEFWMAAGSPQKIFL